MTLLFQELDAVLQLSTCLVHGTAWQTTSLLLVMAQLSFKFMDAYLQSIGGWECVDICRYSKQLHGKGEREQEHEQE